MERLRKKYNIFILGNTNFGKEMKVKEEYWGVEKLEISLNLER